MTGLVAEPWAPDGVQRVDLAGRDAWVARTHGPARPIAAVHGDAEILRLLADHDLPAERSDTSPATIHGVGRLLGRLYNPGGRRARRGRPHPAAAARRGRGAPARCRLDRALVAHGLILQAWGVAFRGAMPSAVLQWLAAERKTTELVVERTRKAFEGRP